MERETFAAKTMYTLRWLQLFHRRTEQIYPNLAIVHHFDILLESIYRSLHSLSVKNPIC